MDKYKFGEFIYQKRKELGLTQDELGQKLKVTNKAISKWETGDNLPDITMIKSLANVLGLTVDELLSQKEIAKENKKNTKINNLLLIFVIALSIIEILTIVLSISIFEKRKNEDRQIDLYPDNLTNIVTINPIDDFLCEEQKITINSKYILNTNYYLKEDITFVISFDINYFYYNEDGTIGLITYVDRIIEVTYTSKDEFIRSEIILEPKMNIDNFDKVKNIDINYEIIECNGVSYCY